MKKFEEALDRVLNQFGNNVVVEQRFVSLLADYNAFYDNPAIRKILVVLTRERFFVEINKISSKKGIFYGDDKIIEDALLCVTKHKSLIKSKVGNIVLANNVIDILADKIIPDFASRSNIPSKIGNKSTKKHVSKSPNAPSRNSKQSSPSVSNSAPSNSTSNVPSFGVWDAINFIFSLLSLIAGNAMFIKFVDGDCWMSVTFILSFLFQNLIFVGAGYFIIERGRVIKDIFASVLMVSTVNSLMPILLMFSSIADFYSNFTWEFDGETLYTLNIGETYEGGIFVFLCIIAAIALNMIRIAVLLKAETPKELYHRVKEEKIYLLIGTIITTIVFALYLSLSVSSYYTYNKEIVKLEEQAHSEILRIQKLGDERKQKDVELAFMGIQLGSNIYDSRNVAFGNSEIKEVSEIKTEMYTEYSDLLKVDSLQIPDCKSFSFRTKLNEQYVDVIVSSYQNVIYEISITGMYDNVECSKIYAEKYGEPTRDSLYIKQDFQPHQPDIFILRRSSRKKSERPVVEECIEVDDNFYWKFRSNSIVITNREQGITYVCDKLKNRVDSYKHKIITKWEKENRRKEIKQARKDSLENVARNRIAAEREKAARVKQLNDI